MPNLDFKSTANIKVNKRIIEQVIGQDDAVNIIKKAARQRRHVLLIGEPGTGKSMLGMGLAELLPKEKLVDIVSFPNPNDENTPLIRTVPAGKGRDLVTRARLEGMGMFKNQNIIMFILVIIAMLAPWWVRSYYKSDIMFTAFFLGGMIFLGAFVIFLNLGKRMPDRIKIPKLIVDNYRRKNAPFYDGTGAHAGALLGDVLHDPFQSFIYSKIYIKNNISQKISEQSLPATINNLFQKHKNKILRKKEKNYEAIYLPKNELSVLGETNGSVSPVEVLSCNRYDYNGKMIKLTTSENKELIVTPKHKIAIWKNNKIVYVEAKDVKENDEIFSKAEDIIIDEQDIIATYSQEQQGLAKSYYSYLGLRKENSIWGYKRIATKLGVSYGRTRWWWERNSAPVPVQTVEYLKNEGLIPLKIDNPKLPLIAKVLGATFGDGGIFENLNGIFLSSSELEATKEFGEDLKQIFGKQIAKNSRIIEGGEKGHSWCYQNTNRNIIRFFMALEAPIGNKTKIPLNTPSWILLDNKLEDEFYGSFFGCEMTSPIIQKNRASLSSVEVGITGTKELKQNRIEFLNQIIYYLSKKGVSISSIYEGKTKNKNLNIFRLLISKKYGNIMKFIIEIKINYCDNKIKRFYTALAHWTKIKKKMFDDLTEKGMGAEVAMNKIRLTPHSLYLITNFFDEHPEYAQL